MKSRILAFAGNKQAGKSTCTNFLHGYQLRAQRIVDDFGITDDGSLVVSTKITGADGKSEAANAILDVGRTDPEFAEWAAYSMWPYIKSYSFAAPLKEISTGLFEIARDQAYGKDSQKNSFTIFRWEEMPAVITDEKLAKQKEIKSLIDKGVLKYHKPGRVTAREFLQFFGTDICRKIYEDVWRSRLIKDIEIASQLNFRIKLLGITEIINGKLFERVHPALVKKDTYIGNVNGVMNAVIVEGKPIGESVLQGEGAGPGATSSALMSDLLSILRGNIKYPFGLPTIKRKKPICYNERNSSNSLYLRLEVKDKPGVLSEITKLLANNRISIQRVIQIPDNKKRSASIIIITHKAVEHKSQNLIKSLKKNNNVIKKPVLIRLF